MIKQKGAFMGFTFGNRHSSQLGILRTTTANRYDIPFVPVIRDLTSDTGNTNGTYLMGSDYTKREIPVSFSFFGLSEEQIFVLKRVFNDKNVHPLIFDEDPYKIWMAKLTGTAIIKHQCFQKDQKRFYFGEGTFVFTAFFPFAKSRYPYLDDYSEDTISEWAVESMTIMSPDMPEKIYPALLTYGGEDARGSIIAYEKDMLKWIQETSFLMDSDTTLTDVNSVIDFFQSDSAYINIDEWAETSKLKKRSDGYGIYSSGSYKLYNAGDVEMPFKVYFEIDTIPKNITIAYNEESISLSNIIAKGNDKYLVVDNGSYSIHGCDDKYKITKNIYNEKITSGNFFKLPVGEILLRTSEQAKRLEFNYLYL